MKSGRHITAESGVKCRRQSRLSLHRYCNEHAFLDLCLPAGNLFGTAGAVERPMGARLRVG